MPGRTPRRRRIAAAAGAVPRCATVAAVAVALSLASLRGAAQSPAVPPAGSARSAPAVVQLPAPAARGPVILDDPYESGPFFPGGGAAPPAGHPDPFEDLWALQPWSWHLLPDNLIYTSYLAGPNEPRFASVWYDDTAPDPFDPSIRNGWMWDMTVGGRVSLLRYGSDPVLHPQGFEIQVEGAAFVRLDPGDEVDLRSSDYRFGIPLVFGIGRWQTKVGYYHLSAHLGDEAMLKHPTFPRVNYLRDAVVWGNSYYVFDWMRIYGDVGYAFNRDGGAEPWEFQFGTELVQARPTGIHGAPFLAVNGMSRQELDWGGNVCVQTGWAWRGWTSERLLRIGFEYLYGSDPQYEFVFYRQNRYGIGVWYDF